jgi:predicted nucleic-acid-binding protein
VFDGSCQQEHHGLTQFAAESIFVPDTVLLETERVLRDLYDFKPATVCAALRHVCGLSNVTLRDARMVAQAIDWHEAGLDFADALHLATSGDMAFRTFDGDFTKKAARHTGRHVKAP